MSLLYVIYVFRTVVTELAVVYFRFQCLLLSGLQCSLHVLSGRAGVVCCASGLNPVSSGVCHTVTAFFTHISLRTVPGISRPPIHASSPGLAPNLLDQHSVFYSVNEGSDGQNYSPYVDI